MPGKYRLEPSPVKNKKLRVWFKHMGRQVHVDFGHSEYEDYTQHRDAQRRANYLTRSAGIRDGGGNLTKDNPMSPNYWARRLLWASREKFVGLE